MLNPRSGLHPEVWFGRRFFIDISVGYRTFLGTTLHNKDDFYFLQQRVSALSAHFHGLLFFLFEVIYTDPNATHVPAGGLRCLREQII